VLHARYLTPLF